MSVRAVVFDVYQTLLEVAPAPVDAEPRWQKLWGSLPNEAEPLTPDEFARRCREVIAVEHDRARAAGIVCPEVFWPDIVAQVVPALARLDAAARDTWLYDQMQLTRSVRLRLGAAEVLRELGKRAAVIGIASNAQPYTLRELDAALAGAGLSRRVFAERVCFWSFEHGFSKPNPHVFQWLSARFQAMGIARPEILMVGDRLDNDVQPARLAGWQTWHLTATPSAPADRSGDWSALTAFFRASVDEARSPIQSAAAQRTS